MPIPVTAHHTLDLYTLLLGLTIAACAPVAPVHTPEEELATLQLAAGLRIELAAAEPMVQEPVAMAFDEAGRLWVVEMRGFMPDIDGKGEDEPIGRVVVLEDENNDGVMDRRTLFLDDLVMPRAIAIVRGGILIAEAQPLWFVEDRDGDLKPDGKTLVDADYGAGGLPEHAPNGLWRGMDNWIYNAKSRVRYRQTHDGWLRDSTEFRGQWGLSHDDAGRLFYNYNWSQLHADLVPPNTLDRNPNHISTSGIDHGLTTDMRVFPIRPNPAVNRGYTPGSLDDEGRLLEFTSASAPLVYRGTALPGDYYGNVFVCEPAANLIKRNLIHTDGLLLTSSFAYPDSEFLASTDERFRPVNLATGPDGALYIADMYRGIIQHGAYMTPYLREQTLERGLDEGIHYGRIWRVTPENWTPAEFPDLSTATLEGLVEALSDPDGWRRDTAQRLLVQRDEPASVGLLRDAALNNASPLGRLHAIWALEGLGKADAELLLSATYNNDPFVRSAALRILGPLASTNESVRRKTQNALAAIAPDDHPHLVLNAALAAGFLGEAAPGILAGIIGKHSANPVMRDAVMSSLAGREWAMLERMAKMPAWQDPDAGQSIFLEMLGAAIARKADEQELATVSEWMASMEPNTEGFRASVRTGLETYTTDTTSTTAGNTLAGEDLERFAAGRRHYLAGCAGCHGNDGAGLPRFAPPLIRSEWVLGDERVLARILLHGMEGPVDVAGQRYGPPDILPVMPPHSILDDAEIASIMTYIRNAWGNAAAPVSPRTVGRIRHGSQGQTLPWTPEQLRTLPDDAP